ncbi:MAG: hypothetical protein M3O23_13210 [Actinomycetota bacterium]|nr:hypothetical protein [Actinomycetota bacterium]
MLPTTAPTSGRTSPSIRPALALAGAVTAALFVVSAVAVAFIPHYDGPSPLYTGPGWLRGWAQWDSGWYQYIADHGYSYTPGQQGPVAFFPAYPLLMRAVDFVVGNVFVAGILVTAASGIGAAVLFWRWVQERLDRPAAWTALLLFVLFPYAFFLFGAVYADALFVVAVLGAFTLVERDRPWLAGLAGAVATAARPIGVVLIVALVVRVLERGQRPTWRSAGVLLSGLGLGAFSVYLWVRFGDPLAFGTIQEAWDQEAGPETWLKFRFFRDVVDIGSPLPWVAYMSHPVLTVVGLALVPGVFRRFGKAYGVFCLLLIGLSALGTKNFFGMSRYVMAAFPCFAVAGEWVAARPRLRTLVPAVSGLGLVVLTAAYSRGYYLS